MKRCLVVDDSRVIRQVARLILEDLQFDVLEAEDARAALELCRQSMPDAILVDGQMPEMNGIDFTRLVRQQPGGAGPAIILCTTDNDAHVIEHARDAGANDVLLKPFDRERMGQKFAI